MLRSASSVTFTGTFTALGRQEYRQRDGGMSRHCPLAPVPAAQGRSPLAATEPGSRYRWFRRGSRDRGSLDRRSRRPDDDIRLIVSGCLAYRRSHLDRKGDVGRPDGVPPRWGEISPHPSGCRRSAIAGGVTSCDRSAFSRPAPWELEFMAKIRWPVARPGPAEHGTNTSVRSRQGGGQRIAGR